MRFFTLILCLFSLSASAQNSVDCAALAKKEVEMDTTALRQSLNDLKHCGLDSIDEYLFCNTPSFAAIAVQLFNTHKSLTYGDFLHYVDSIKQQPEYREMKAKIVAFWRVGDKIASLNTWAQDTQPISDMGFSSTELLSARNILERHQNQEWTYKQLFSYSAQIQKEESKEKEDRREVQLSLAIQKQMEYFASYCDTALMKLTPFGLLTFTSYKAGLACARKMNRKAIVYFEGNYAVNCRKFEEMVLRNAEVSEYINNNCVFIDLKCDDETPLPKPVKNIKTIGDENEEIEERIYHVSTQPLIVVLNAQGKEVARSFYTTNPGEFMELLRK